LIARLCFDAAERSRLHEHGLADRERRRAVQCDLSSAAVVHLEAVHADTAEARDDAVERDVGFGARARAADASVGPRCAGSANPAVACGVQRSGDEQSDDDGEEPGLHALMGAR
jgi:hypothetical protein